MAIRQAQYLIGNFPLRTVSKELRMPAAGIMAKSPQKGRQIGQGREAAERAEWARGWRVSDLRGSGLLGDSHFVTGPGDL